MLCDRTDQKVAQRRTSFGAQHDHVDCLLLRHLEDGFGDMSPHLGDRELQTAALRSLKRCLEVMVGEFGKVVVDSLFADKLTWPTEGDIVMGIDQNQFGRCAELTGELNGLRQRTQGVV